MGSRLVHNRSSIPSKFDRKEFVDYLVKEVKLNPDTAYGYGVWANKFQSSKQTIEDFLDSYENINTFNNALKAIRHYCNYLCIPIPNIKIKQNSPDRLIIAPKKKEVLDLLQRIQSKELKTYLALCATNGIRSQRFRRIRWTELDLDNLIININENVRTKHYRPQALHRDVALLLKELPRTSEFVFKYGKNGVLFPLRRLGTPIRPSNLRDFFYNTALNVGMNSALVEWLMGHSIGIKAHYLADQLKQEYRKFERSFRISLN